MKFFSATFPDGTRFTRSSARTYTHAWVVKVSGRDPWPDEIEAAARFNADGRDGAKALASWTGPITSGGFSGSERLAANAARAWLAKPWKDRSVLSVMITPVLIHATRKEMGKEARA